jgi:hypothetical protein
MRKIEGLIKEYCAQNLPLEPAWITILNRRFPRLAARFDGIKSVQWEIEDHLQTAFEASLSKGQSPENAWKNAKDQFGDLSRISREIFRARSRSRYCLLIRLMALILLIDLPAGISPLPFPERFIQGESLSFMAVCIVLGFLMTRRRDLESVRKFAYYGTWMALLWGLLQAIVMEMKPWNAGRPTALIIMSTFYGLFLVAPSVRGWKPIAMFALCQIGVQIPLVRSGIVPIHPMRLDLSLWPMVATASVVTIVVGLMVFDIRRLANRLTGLAGFGMFYCYCQILQSLTRPVDALSLVLATSIPLLAAALVILPIRKIRIAC